jgi:hypothetical protein
MTTNRSAISGSVSPAAISASTSPAAHDQAEDRVHRIGQQEAVTAWYLLAADTIDERIAAVIDRKQEDLGTVRPEVLGRERERERLGVDQRGKKEEVLARLTGSEPRRFLVSHWAASPTPGRPAGPADQFAGADSPSSPR